MMLLILLFHVYAIIDLANKAN